MKNYDEQEDLRDPDTEITLGTKSVLGIFFGLALVCGVFFGFGYSLGRGNSTVKPPLPSAATPESAAAAPSPIKTVVEGTSSDSGASGYGPVPNAVKPSPASAAVVSQPIAPAAGALVPAVQTQAVPAHATAPIVATTTPAVRAPSPASAAAPANIMVQIAAVSRPDDANALVAALRKLGYSASARAESGDSLLHVQIGPFATRDQAIAMRTRLMGDGYNAILK